jgi:hypothetical protein
LLEPDVPGELRHLALLYLGGCATDYARERLLRIADMSGDPLSLLALAAAAHANSPAPILPRRGPQQRAPFARLDAAVAASIDGKDRQATGTDGESRQPRGPSWPPTRRPA